MTERPRLATDADAAREAAQAAKEKQNAQTEAVKTAAGLLLCIAVVETLLLQGLGIAVLVRNLRRG